jgi:hypothetical protein
MPCGRKKNGCVNCDGTSEIPFQMHVPFSTFLRKSDGRMRIGGIVSTEHKDYDGEIVKQDGLDFTPCLRGGWFNNNHSKDTEGVLGIPDLVRRTTYKGKPATYVEGDLISGYEPAEKIWQLGKALQNTKRPLGFSLQGKVIRREGPDRKIVAEAVVKHIAITAIPVNAETALQTLSKSMDCETHRRSAQAAMRACVDAIGCLTQGQLMKALAAGSSIANPGAAAGEGFPLRQEDLEPGMKTTTYKGPRKKRPKKTKRVLSKAQALDVIRGRFGQQLAPATAERIFRFAAQGA